MRALCYDNALFAYTEVGQDLFHIKIITKNIVTFLSDLTGELFVYWCLLLPTGKGFCELLADKDWKHILRVWLVDKSVKSINSSLGFRTI